MKKRFPAFFLALALCLGLAVPAFAADAGTSAQLYPWISEDFPYVGQNLEYKWRATDKNGTYGKAEDDNTDFIVVPTHEYFNVIIQGVEKGGTLFMTAYTDHDGDGVYDERCFTPTTNAKGDVELAALPIPENGAYSGVVFHIVPVANFPGVKQMEDGGYALSAADLHNFFGNETQLHFFVGEDNHYLGSVWLCEGPFDDVPGAGWYSDPVAWAAEKGITTGTGEGEFTPGDDCTHIQILTFLSRAAGNTKAGEYDWATEQKLVIKWAEEKGMIDDSFNGQKSCTRAEAVNYIWQAKDKPNAQPSTFKDMGGYEQYAKAVDWAYEKGITKGSGNGIFDPGSVCNRAYIATFLYRAYN